MANLPTERPVWVFNEDSFPCSCCNPAVAMEGGLWTCLREKGSWIVLDELPDLSVPHCAAVCDGTCGDVFHRGIYLLMAYSETLGLTWGDVDYLCTKEELAKLSEAERAAREAEEEARRRREEAEAELKALSAKLASKARDHEIKAGYTCNKGKKEMRPCKYLYSCEGDRKSGGARPTTLHISSECWSHAYTDPTTGQRVEKHCCWYLHPGEEGWLKEWNRNRNFVPAQQQQPPSRFAALSDKPSNRNYNDRRQTQKPIQKPTKKIQNAFAALDDE